MKAKFAYTVRSVQAPGESTPSLIPVVTSKFSPVDLATVLEKCIDRGLIAGLKANAAEGIADGIVEQIAYEFTQGRGVKFGEYFYGRPYLTGQVSANGNLTSDNKLKVRLYKGAEFKLGISDFSFTFDGSGDTVKVDNIYGNTSAAGGNTYGQIVANSPVVINGKNLFAVGDTVKVVFDSTDGAEHIEVSDFTYAGGNQLVCAWPALTKSTYNVKVERTDAAGTLRMSKYKLVSVIAAVETMVLTNIVDVEQEEGVVDVVTKGTRFNMYGDNIGPFEWEQGTSLLMNATLTVTYTDTNDQTQTQDILIDAMKSATQAGGGAYLAIGAGESGWQDNVKASTRPTITYTHTVDGITHRASRSFALVG